MKSMKRESAVGKFTKFGDLVGTFEVMQLSGLSPNF